MTDDPKVIDFKRARDEIEGDAAGCGLSIDHHAGRNLCRHNQTSLNRKQRIAECNGCGALLDPFDVLVKFAETFDRYQWELTDLRREVQQARDNLADLKRQERNTKARLRRLDRKLAEQDPPAVLHAGMAVDAGEG